MRAIEKAWPDAPFRGLILLGEHETLQALRAALPSAVSDRVVHVGPRSWDGEAPDIEAKVQEVLEDALREHDTHLVADFERRMHEHYLVAAGPQQMSRSVMTPSSLPAPSVTGTVPQSPFHIRWATSAESFIPFRACRCNATAVCAWHHAAQGRTTQVPLRSANEEPPSSHRAIFRNSCGRIRAAGGSRARDQLCERAIGRPVSGTDVATRQVSGPCAGTTG